MESGARDVLPSRGSLLASCVAYGASAGALWGAAEAAREVVGGGLLLGGGAVAALVGAGAAGAAVPAALVAAGLAALPRRPLGRVRWSAFLTGLYVPTIGSAGVAWFTDPPPFTDPFRFQGSLPVFALLALGVALALGVLYQAARGARSVAGAASVLGVGLGVWVYAAQRGPAAPSQAPPAGAPNVLLVTLDTVRADRFGAYGNEQVQTRVFDALAKDGALFLDATAVAPITGPSHASMLMGAGPWDHGVMLNGADLPARPLLTEILRDHGWSTAAFVSAYVLDGDLGFRRGFEVYDDDFGWLRGGSSLLPARLSAMLRRHADPDVVLQRRAGDTVDGALAWLEGRGGAQGAWFLWVHLFDAHGPYEPPPPWNTQYYQGDPTDPANTSMQAVTGVAPYLERSLSGITDVNYVIAQYDGEVSYADSQLGRLLAAIDARDTLVAVIGDHGESLGEHGVWFNHGDDVYETSVHVPFAMRWPGRVPAGARVERPFEGSDLAPTLLDLVGIAVPASMTGHSAVPTLTGGGGNAFARSLCFDRPANRDARAAGLITKPVYRVAGLRGSGARYVRRETSSEGEYFDLLSDARGLIDVRASVAASPEGAELLRILDAQAGALFSSGVVNSGELSAEERERLELLGYSEP